MNKFEMKSDGGNSFADNEDSNDSVIDLASSPELSTQKPDKKRKRDKSILQSINCKNSAKWVTSSFGDFDAFDCFAASSRPAKSAPKRANTTSSSQSILKVSKSATTSISNTADQSKASKTTPQINSEQVSSSGDRCWLSGKKRPAYESELWSDKYAPNNQGDLAVHKKKISDLETWFQTHLKAQAKLPPILILTGQAGTGKSATVKVLSRELKCDVQEWSNPVGSDRVWKKRDEFSTGPYQYDDIQTESQLVQFQHFLLRANKYNKLDIFGDGNTEKKIILVEEFPNVFYRDASAFHETLRKYAHVGKCPLVFIVSDSTSRDSASCERLLFPKTLQQDLRIDNISFNPIALTSLTKVLTRIATKEASQGLHKFTAPTHAILESIAMSSAGDIRGAINTLQFACLRDTKDLLPSALVKGKQPVKKPRGKAKSKSSDKKDSDLASIGGRDTSLFLFRALGKILYCKRDDPSAHPDEPKLAVHLQEHHRDPLIINPEDVVEKSHLSGDYFSAYLHQNYMEFFTDLDDIARASQYLSDADHLTEDWASRSVLQQYAASVATRGIIHANSARARFSSAGSGLGWKPLHKPQWYTAIKQARDSCESARCLFKEYAWTPEILQTEILPYLSVINTTLHQPGQASFLQEFCRFSKLKIPGRSEKLDEKDVDTDESPPPSQSMEIKSVQDDDEFVSNSQSKVRTAQEEEEELIIEDFDD
ncbi:cell cycle checkpoint protein RAD17-like [Mizuhopecten yessoensis]|uniref:Cell cycle checkpoint protein RAD17 n=1 Tax=Mizuhopecten yessoensis TaxID=6573 RepID=A0A210PNN5_MIZYE|nr:cell cycle checkpoint protein RAD17-like [Mizuhopecten yessoensis]OWF38083.1 Cell cycle checkpoint protein RAD17 [Mizuhopecten yessoensis]